MSDSIKNWLDGLSVTNIIIVFMDLVPDFTAILTLVWMCIRIYETHTVKNLIKRWRK